ncbi:MAG: hypothetical protein LBP56_09740, partial [Odoribacteraceae bacterium]|nr:hypothetical protein [Odoribacteraceae bacterium]
ESNSYIINPLTGNVQATYGVPVFRVNRFWGSEDGTKSPAITPTTEWEAEVIWQDKAGEGLINFCESNGTVIDAGKYAGTGENNFYFSPAGPAASGNVLIGVKRKGAPASEGYLWSWHLWLTNYNPDAAPPSWQEDVYSYLVAGGAVHRYAGAMWSTSYPDKFIMDRNLGATSATRADGMAKTGGLHYQFGRKDPFPAAGVQLYNVSGAAVTAFTATAGDGIVVLSGATAIKTAVQHPYIFYAEGSDWVQSNPYTANSWNNPGWYTSVPKAGKSLFDPCPPGWRLPVDGAWATFSLDNVHPSDDGFAAYTSIAGWEFYLDNVLKNARAYHPATGYRTPTKNGNMDGGGYGAYIWSSTPLTGNSVQTWYFLARESSVGHSYMPRSYGNSVRCIQE